MWQIANENSKFKIVQSFKVKLTERDTAGSNLVKHLSNAALDLIHALKITTRYQNPD